MEDKYLLERIRKRLGSLKETKEEIQRLKKEGPAIFDKEKLLKEKRETLYKICEIIGVDDSKKGILVFGFIEIMKEIFEFIPKYFELYEKFLETLGKYDKLENELVKAQTLVWFQHGCTISNLTRILITPDLYEMFKMLVPEKPLRREK